MHNFVRVEGALLNENAKFDFGSIMMYPPNMGTLPTELRSWVKTRKPSMYHDRKVYYYIPFYISILYG